MPIFLQRLADVIMNPYHMQTEGDVATRGGGSHRGGQMGEPHEFNRSTR